MKRYLLFAGSTYYPAGGANDLIGTFQTEKEAVYHYHAKKLNDYLDWGHVYDLETNRTRYLKYN